MSCAVTPRSKLWSFVIWAETNTWIRVANFKAFLIRKWRNHRFNGWRKGYVTSVCKERLDLRMARRKRSRTQVQRGKDAPEGKPFGQSRRLVRQEGLQDCRRRRSSILQGELLHRATFIIYFYKHDVLCMYTWHSQCRLIKQSFISSRAFALSSRMSLHEFV